jgi:hypothetical protein
MKRYRKPILITGLNIGFLLVLWAYPYMAGPVHIESNDSSLNLINTTEETIYYSVVLREQLDRINWADCNRPQECNSISPQQAETVMFKDIPNYRPGVDLIVAWWHLEKASNGKGFKVVDFASRFIPAAPAS